VRAVHMPTTGQHDMPPAATSLSDALHVSSGAVSLSDYAALHASKPPRPPPSESAEDPVQVANRAWAVAASRRSGSLDEHAHMSGAHTLQQQISALSTSFRDCVCLPVNSKRV
jgi:hypothetical protein